jgi:hypothetical protein
MARSMVGDGSIGSPSLHIRSFQLSQKSLSACWTSASPFVRISADCAARMPAIAHAFPSSFVRACGRRPKGAWGDASAPSGHPTADQIGMWARSYRSSASTHPLQVCRCVAGMYRPKAVARRASRLRRPRKDGSRQPSGFPTVRSQRRQETCSTWRGISESGCWYNWKPFAAARGSFSKAPQYSTGSAGSCAAVVVALFRTTAAANVSFCFGVGMRRLAGRSHILLKRT